jgi:hypothetical protein
LFLVIVVGSLGMGLYGARRLGRAGFVQTALLGRGVVIAAIGMLAAFTFLSAQYEKNLWLLLGASAALASIARRAEKTPVPESEASPARAAVSPWYTPGLPSPRVAGLN